MISALHFYIRDFEIYTNGLYNSTRKILIFLSDNFNTRVYNDGVGNTYCLDQIKLCVNKIYTEYILAVYKS